MNTTDAVAKTIADTLEIAKMAIQEVEDILDNIETEDLTAHEDPLVPDYVKLNKRGQRLVELMARPEGAHIDFIADELCVERESVRSLVSKVTRRIGRKAECKDGVYRLHT